MANIGQRYKRIRSEDFEEEQRETIDKLASPINDGFQTLFNVVQNNITFGENIACTIAEFTVSVDASGTPRSNIFLKLANKLPVLGILPINVVPLDNVYPTAGVGFTWNQTTKQQVNGVVISNIQGLPPLKNFTIRVLIIN